MGRPCKDLTCTKIGSLTILHKLHNYHKKGVHWLCVCECGNLTEVSSDNLLRGYTKSCSCLRLETVKKHGKKGTKLYHCWQNMKDRCYNEHNKHYKDYGRRGIKVCNEWRNDFMNFYNWAVNNGYDDTLTIDRIDNNKGYSHDNCRWATLKQQARNQRSNKNITINGKTHCLSEWCEIYNINYRKVQSRLKYGWTIEKALELNERGDTD